VSSPLDLEGTLISNSVSRISRPGPYAFLEQCQALFERGCIFTAVDQARFRDIAHQLVEEGAAPGWFANIEYIDWTGPTKALRFVSGVEPQRALLVDDYEVYVHAGQASQSGRISLYDYHHSEYDNGLFDLLDALRVRTTQCAEYADEDRGPGGGAAGPTPGEEAE
jgi:hypothetical protein